MTKTLQLAVLKRYMDSKELGDFIDRYNENLYSLRVMKKPSEKDLRILSLLKKEKSYNKVSKMLGLSTYQVMSAVGRVSAYKN